ncbi:armadillo-type protein [Irpex lacteus]|nr:armadillo-type protein [Irpex lacteus]
MADLNQLVQAILIAADPTQGALHNQALEFLSTVQQNSANTWRVALELFVETGPDGSRKYPPQARFFALRVLEDFLDNRFEPLEDDAFQVLRQSFISYIQSEYLYGPAEASAVFIRNKFSHTLTLLFLATYLDQWQSFFADLFTLIRPPESTSQSTFNAHVSLLFFHLVLEISGEVADQIIKSARTYSAARHARDTRVRDAVRDRDASAINEAVLTIVADGVERMGRLRKGDSSPAERELDTVTEVVDWGIRTFASYVGWIDINLTVTPTTIPLLFNLLSDSSLPIRLATCGAITKIVGKGLKEPTDKLQLIKVLSLAQVIDALETKTRGEQAIRGSEIDEGEESYREALGRLLNMLGLELSKLVDECPIEDVKNEATQLLNQTLPVMLRFMADEYDDTCSTIFPFLQTVLGSYKRERKSTSDPLDETRRSFLTQLLNVILQKLKWDEEADLEDMDEDDKAEFETLRKDLRTFMDAVFVIDQGLVSDALSNLALGTMNAYKSGVPVKWHDAELAVYIVYIFGEINKTGTKGRAAFCRPLRSRQGQEERTDYSAYPLTRMGDALHSSPGIHNPESSLRSRVFYLFHLDLPELESPEQDLLAEAIKHPGIFDAQLYLFETVGTLVSLFYKSPEQREGYTGRHAILKVHHNIMALGNIAKASPTSPRPYQKATCCLPVEIFTQIAQAILVSLEALNVLRAIRDATRNAFTRTILLKRRGDLFDVLDELIGPLNTKRAYLTLLNNIMASKLHGIFTSSRNQPQLEALLGACSTSEDVSDPSSQSSAIPGFERFVYERLIPAAFSVLASPQFNIKDGQMLVVLHEICNFLQRWPRRAGQEAYDFFTTVFLPSQGWPNDAAVEFATKLRDLDSKSFKKYLADFVRASRS